MIRFSHKVVWMNLEGVYDVHKLTVIVDSDPLQIDSRLVIFSACNLCKSKIRLLSLARGWSDIK